MVDFTAELNRIVRERPLPFSQGEALWFSGAEPGLIDFEWKQGRIGGRLDVRKPKLRHGYSLKDILYLAGLAEFGPVRRPIWRDELRKGFPRAILKAAEVYHFGPYPVVMAPIRRRLNRRLHRLAAMRLYVVGDGVNRRVAGTGVSPFLIARRLAAEGEAALLKGYPELTARDLRRGCRYAKLHFGPGTVVDYRAAMAGLATAPCATGDRRLQTPSDRTLELLGADPHAIPIDIRAWREKYSRR